VNFLIIKFIAPFETGFNLHSHKSLSNNISYRKFWDNIKSNVIESFPEIEFLHTYIDKAKQKFVTITDDANTLSAELFIIKEEQIKPYISNSLIELAHKHSFVIDSITSLGSCCKIYDNNIGVIELGFEIPFSDVELIQHIDEIQEFSNELMQNVLKKMYTDLLAKFFSEILKTVGHKDFIDTLDIKKEENVCPLWINRSLFVMNKDRSSLKILAEKWLTIGSENLNTILNDLMDEGIYLGWGHNLFLTEIHSLKSKQAIEALLLCQYYNAVIDNLNNKLSILIGETFLYKKFNNKTKMINKRLNNILSNTKLLLLQLNETEFNLQGFKQYYFLDLVTKWKLKTLKVNLEDKLQFCKEKIEEIYQQQTKKNQAVTEIILFGIGGLTLVDFFLNISQYAFAILTSSKNIHYQYIKIPGILDIASRVTPNGMIGSGFILFFVIFMLYSIFQSRSR
jgi:hypothetical protein